jgi:hypothetical protein
MPTGSHHSTPSSRKARLQFQPSTLAHSRREAAAAAGTLQLNFVLLLVWQLRQRIEIRCVSGLIELGVVLENMKQLC